MCLVNGGTNHYRGSTATVLCALVANGQTGEIVSGTNVDNSGNVLLMAQLVCEYCAYAMLFALMPIGLV
jgi:hypothetical protein